MFSSTQLAAVEQSLHEIAATHGQQIPTLAIACVDPRLNPLLYALDQLYPSVFTIRNPGSCVAGYDAQYPCDAAAAVDMLAQSVGRIVHIGHDSCAYCQIARDLLQTDGRGPLFRTIKARGLVVGDDKIHAGRQVEFLLSHPTVGARRLGSSLEVIGLFVTADGRVMIYDFEERTYKPMQAV